jgi:hypothetical protein
MSNSTWYDVNSSASKCSRFYVTYNGKMDSDYMTDNSYHMSSTDFYQKHKTTIVFQKKVFDLYLDMVNSFGCKSFGL